nr:hypothetical protein [uncultured Flavobacterium sp.]
MLPVYNAQTGAFIGFAKESNVGKSKYDTREEQSHLRHITESNLYDGSLKGYEHNAVEKAKVPNYKYRTVEEFVQDYIDGKMTGTPEEQDFYRENSEAIEQAFRNLTEEDKAAAEKEIDKRRKEVVIPEKFFEGQKAEYVEGMSEQDYINAVLQDSENPAQIAGAWLMSPKNEGVEGMNQFGDLDADAAIYNFFKDGNTISTESFKKIADKNHLNRKDIPAYDRYFSKDGYNPDGLEMRQYGKDITMQDVADFIMKFPNGHGGYAENMKTSKRYKLSQKFERVAGRTLTESFAKKLADEEARRQEFLAQDEGMAAMDADLDAQYQADIEAEQERNRVFAETGQFQKESARKGDFNKDTPNDKLSSIDFVFSSHPKLKKLFGNNKSLYNKYLNSIFPNSKVKDIVYHGSSSPLIGEVFDKEKAFNNTGFIYFTNKEYAKEFMIGKNSVMYSVLVDLQNPLIHNSEEFNNLSKTLKNLDLKHDGVINESGDSYDKKSEEYIVREPEQVHVIGSSQDILMASKFLSNFNNRTNFNKVLERIKKVMPKVNVVIDNTIEAAGQVQGNTLKVNPDYAGLDTPIHEAGHILIDAIGYKNRVIQKAISQLKDSPLWKETQERYPELNEEMLGKEVLAEAIGREGADVFDNQVAKSKFKAILDYIFDKLKSLLGINKNVAKSLAKQIISGIGTKDLQGTTEAVQEQKPKKPLTPEEMQAKELMDYVKEHDLAEIPYEKLIKIYNVISSAEIRNKTKYQSDLERRIALNLKERGLQNSQKQVDEGVLAHKDISWYDKWFKVLSWFDEKFPEMKELSKMWNTAFFNKMKEARAEKNTHDKLAEAVVDEKNKRLGIVEKGKSLLSNRAYKAFEYLDNGKGKLLTVAEAKAKGLSDAQIKYLEYVRNLLAKQQEIDINEDINSVDMDVIKLDKGFSEAFQSDGFVAAVGSFFGNNNDLLATEITFTNPNTGKEQRARFADVQTILNKYGENGVKEKAKAALLMVKYGREAKNQLRKDIETGKTKKGRTDRIILDEKGNLLSRFGGERIQGRAYSKDFYNAVSQYIDDSAHIKHISPLVPIINSINLLTKNGAYVDGEIISEKKQNLSQWMDMWVKQHVLRKPDENEAALDTAIKTLRFATSGIAMWFNVPANVMNVAIGNYNNWRQENGTTWAKGNKRLFGNLKYSAAILNKYVAVSNDIDSNPFMGVKNKLSALGYLGQKWGEWQIQGSGLLGLMTEEEYNSFEFKKNQYGVEELVIKDGVDKKKLEDKILSLIDKVSDVQGKYSAKDRMNVMNNELGKIAMQFKVWIPAWVHARFGDEGSYKIAYRNFLKDGLKELRADLKDKGFIKTYKDNKAFAQNLRGALTIGFLMSLAYQDDDDKEKSAASEFAQKALHDVLFIFDPQNLKYTLTHPVAITGTIEKFINAFEHLIYLEEYKGDSKYGDKGDLKIQGDILSATPAGNVMDIVDSVTEEE